MGHISSPGLVCLSSCLYPGSGEGANGFCPLIFTVKVKGVICTVKVKGVIFTVKVKGVKDAREMEVCAERF